MQCGFYTTVAPKNRATAKETENMSLTRKMLKAMGIEDEKIDQIIEAHTETVDALKEQRDSYKADAEKLPEVQKELDVLKAAGDGGYKEKYEAEHTAFEKYKADQTAKETRAAKETAYRDLLKASGVSEKRIDTVMRASGPIIDGLELAEDGKAKDADKLTEGIKAEWADFIPTTTTQGAPTATPPVSTDEPNKDNLLAVRKAMGLPVN